MKNTLKKVTIKNSVTGIFLQLCNLLSTFIIPKIILLYFGSETNGLVSSITNFLLYISLFEASISNIVMGRLYEPIRFKNSKSISKVFNTCDYFYRQITVIFIIYTVLVASIYPIVFRTAHSYLYTFILVLVISITYLVQYSFSNSLRTLLKANRQVYIVNITQSAIIILNLLFTIVSVRLFPSIHLLKFISGALYIIQPIVFKVFVSKQFYIDKHAGIDRKLLKCRWDGLAISVASFVHNMTDIALLTLFCDLKEVSVYSVYYLVVRGLEAIMTSISNGIMPSLGNIVAGKDKNELRKKFRVYELCYSILTLIIMATSCVLITPFVLLYTSGIHDANYDRFIFGILILIGEAFFLFKMPHQNLAYATNSFKEMKKPAYIEALINIIVSVLLINKMGLIGVAIGTTVAMVFSYLYQLKITKNILGIPVKRSLLIVLVGTIILLLLQTPFHLFKIKIDSWTLWVLFSLVIILVSSIVFILFSLVVSKKDTKKMIQYFKPR